MNFLICKLTCGVPLSAGNCTSLCLICNWNLSLFIKCTESVGLEGIRQHLGHFRNVRTSDLLTQTTAAPTSRQHAYTPAK